MADLNKFNNIEFLKDGNEVQKRSYQIIKDNRIMEILQDFQPLLTGTIPIEINTESSDLDIICYWENNERKQELKSIMLKEFSKFTDFNIREYIREGKEVLFSDFKIDGMEFEIFTQNIPTKQQNAYRHMVVEYQILLEKDQDFKNEIINLKKSGLRTEPAFGKLLNISGNPYDELLVFKHSYN
ncbi:hypothetical protein DICPUDRAFT_86401 [Dictyostelium purpureum]|uniref:DUF4269 domain-containing protein n=1 Tax=Dictyostelium purpureum TaxID=5786 RepID=F0ZBF3_DICPU|nr:uncharacterized protein DICPUDRAFT_86401 [Dictyostelium purpureum]EGC38736.1 hypothetical protein DICPUDRAFT_86401 [Dictyostelium purpureum]|eukprot:XP_003284727.1 hypothetical protein DICPUDRAFT_86401 [Dictyostelium purpureum]